MWPLVRAEGELEMRVVGESKTAEGEAVTSVVIDVLENTNI
jgi:hypothetical protein